MGEFVQKTAFHLGDPGEFITTDDFIYRSDRAGVVAIGAGFVTDFASIPNVIPRWLFDPMKHARWSALPHDFLCRTSEDYVERVEADWVFHEAMVDEGVKRWRRNCMFAAVRTNSFRMKLIGRIR